MRVRWLCGFLLLACLPAAAKYIPDPIVRYRIRAALDPAAKTVRGSEVILWRNHSTGAVPDLQFHLYLNAFKNTYSTFMREGGAASRRVRFRADADAWGYEQIHSLKVDGEDLTAALEYIQPDDGNPDDQTVLRVPLKQPVIPGGSVKIEIEWTSKLPHVFARTGFHDDFFFVAQWFPKPGVYEAAGERHRATSGWNTHQFHMNTEFYAEFGVFDVDLTVPSSYTLAATGVERSRKDNGDGTTTYNYYQEDVHDFAWTTQPSRDAVKLERVFRTAEQVTQQEVEEWSRKTGAPPGEVRLEDVKVILFLQRENVAQAERHFRATFAAIKWFGLMYGRYPYDVITVVDAPFGGEGAEGMEYPTFITAGTEYWPGDHSLSYGPESVTVHEFGHQYWYGLVANNEFEDAWLDEGINTYSTAKVLERAYGPNYAYERPFGTPSEGDVVGGIPIPGRAWLQIPVPRFPWRGVGEVGVGQYWEWIPLHQRYGRARRYWDNARSDSMQRNAWQTLTRRSYQAQAYSKPELTLHTLESLLGDAWPRVIRTYHQRWRFRHPDARDFLSTVQEVSDRDLSWFFDQTVFGNDHLNYSVSFTSGEAPDRAGFFDRDGRPELRRAEGVDRIESEVLVRRLGEMRFPVVVRVRFADGSEAAEVWDGQYRWAKFKYTGRPRIVSAEIDRSFAWKLEVPRTDDTALAEPVHLAADKWYLRWVVWIQNVLLAFSFFG